MTDAECGEPCEDGTPCERDAGWGTGRDIGPCIDHQQDHRKLRKLDEETKQTLIGAAQEGAKHEHCAMLAGIRPRTLRRWREWAMEDIEAGRETDLTEFYVRYQRARAGGAVETLQDCSPEFLAERSYGYTKTEKREVEAHHEHDSTDDLYAAIVGSASDTEFTD